MNDFFDKKEGKDYDTILIPSAKYEKFWQDLPLSQEINNNWKDLRSKIKTEFMDIAMNLGVSFKYDDGNYFRRTCEPCRKEYSSNQWSTKDRNIWPEPKFYTIQPSTSAS